MCDNHDCKCTYCKGDNYDRYMKDHLSECLDNINRILENPISSDDPRLNLSGQFNEELFYNAIMLQSQEEIYKLRFPTNKYIPEGIPEKKCTNDVFSFKE